jgi:signal recognition particle GTPase
MTPCEFVTLFEAEQDNPESRAKYDAIHQKMADFVLAVVKYFAVHIKQRINATMIYFIIGANGSGKTACGCRVYRERVVYVD